jgi:hypothetical protein
MGSEEKYLSPESKYDSNGNKKWQDCPLSSLAKISEAFSSQA